MAKDLLGWEIPDVKRLDLWHKYRDPNNSRRLRLALCSRRRTGLYERLFIKCWGICPLCNLALPEDSSQVHIDHILPQAKEGTWDEDNLQLTHKECNLKKGDNANADFRQTDFLWE